MYTEIDEILIEWYKKALTETYQSNLGEYSEPTKQRIRSFNSGCISTIKDTWMALHDGEEMSNELEEKIRREINE